MAAQDFASIKTGRDWTPEIIQQLNDLELLFDETEINKMFFNISAGEKSEKQCSEDLGYDASGSVATPIIQVFSVSIETSIDNDRPYEIYGSIRGTKGQDTSFHLYDRGCEDAEAIWKQGTLSLIGPEYGIRSLIVPENGIFFPFMGINLDICLKDRIRDVEVIKGSVNLDSITEEDSFDKLLKVVIQGEYGIVYISYTIFQFAVLGTIEVAITELKDNQSGRFADIYGSLVAGYGNSKRYCQNDDDPNNLKSTLLRLSSDQPMHVMTGNPIPLSRCVLVVPAYSSMILEVNLWDSLGKSIIGDQVEINVNCGGDSIVYIESEYACLRVKVKWRNAYVQLYKKRNAKAQNRTNEDSNSMVMHKKPRVTHDKQLQSYSSMNGIATLCVSGTTYYARDQVEIFSIHIGGIMKEISALCGTIFIDEGCSKFYIYNKGESSIELLADDSCLSIEGSSQPISNAEFGMGINLKDPIQDLEVSKGTMCWQVIHLGANMSWYNKPLCTVIRGKDGFAAVHYTIFSDAFAASIEARIIFDSHDDVPVNVFGHLWTQYSRFDYSKKYQKKYYRSRLFNLPRSMSVELKTGSIVPLCKSVVAVPIRSSLLIESDLKIIRPLGDGNLKEEAVFGIEEFENNMSSNSKVIKGVDYKIELSVKFSEGTN